MSKFISHPTAIDAILNMKAQKYAFLAEGIKDETR